MKLSGIINIDKPKGFTSHDVVAKIRKILHIKQVGHTGTLDPLATGVLPICIGKATKTIQYLDSSKAYRAYMKLGIKTDSFDTDGVILEQNSIKLDLEQIKKHLQEFHGQITQTPPVFSAVHYKGKRLYEYARENIKVEDIPSRVVTVNKIDFVEVLEVDSSNPVVVFDVDCSSGTYIRSIINDLGNKLGYGACMSGLIRTRACNLKISDSYTIEEIEESVKDNKVDFILNPLSLINLEGFTLDAVQLDKISKGQKLEITNGFEQGQKLKLEYENKLAAIAEIKEDKICPINVFVD